MQFIDNNSDIRYANGGLIGFTYEIGGLWI
jgi:hypothetical protein